MQSMVESIQSLIENVHVQDEVLSNFFTAYPYNDIAAPTCIVYNPPTLKWTNIWAHPLSGGGPKEEVVCTMDPLTETWGECVYKNYESNEEFKVDPNDDRIKHIIHRDIDRAFNRIYSKENPVGRSQEGYWAGLSEEELTKFRDMADVSYGYKANRSVGNATRC
jgi:hypothetical protein